MCEWCGVYMPDYEEPGFTRLCDDCLGDPEAYKHHYYETKRQMKGDK